MNGLCGLSNLGNTCYMNSVIQSLSNNQTLREYLFKLDCKDKETVVYKFKQLIEAMWDNNTPIQPISFRKTFGNKYKQFAGTIQNDSAECLSFLLNEIHQNTSNDIRKFISKPTKEINTVMYNLYAKEWSKIIELFYGQYECTTQCTECNHSSFNYDPFMILPLDLSNESKKLTLDNLIEYYVTGEILDKDNCWFCDKCKKKVITKRKIRIAKSPKNLIIHLKRFNTEVKGKTVYLSKNNTLVDFPETLCKFNKTYHLSSVVCHTGSLVSGHYFTFNKKNNEWFLFNDANVSKSNLDKNYAYLLFYN